MPSDNHENFIFPHEVVEGISLINEGQFFKAHEVLEEQWILERHSIRKLYQGLIQFSVACYHIQRGNANGALKLLSRAISKLAPFRLQKFPIDIIKLIKNIEILINRLEQFGNSTTINEYEITYPKIEFID